MKPSERKSQSELPESGLDASRQNLCRLGRSEDASGGKLIVSTYGYPSAKVARQRIRDAYAAGANVRQLPTRKREAG